MGWQMSLWDKSGPPTVSVNKDLLEHGHYHSFTYCGHLHNTVEVEYLRLTKPKLFTI